MASVSWPSATAAPDGTTIGFNSSGLLTVLQAPKLVLPSGISVAQDPSGYLGIFSASGSQVETIDAAGHHVFANTSGSTSYGNFEIITNGTQTSLTGTHNFISNNAPQSGIAFVSSDMILNGLGNPVAVAGNTANQLQVGVNLALANSFSKSFPATISNVGAFTGASAFSAVNLSASYSTTSTTPVSTGLGTAGVPVSIYSKGNPIVVSFEGYGYNNTCLLYTSPSPRD